VLRELELLGLQQQELPRQEDELLELELQQLQEFQNTSTPQRAQDC
jgi:hypothetical protein